MDHSHMDHSGHSGMDMGTMDRCNMNMLFTWDTNNLCIVFRWWHIRGPISLVVSLLGVVALTAAYEALRALSRRYELSHEKQLEETPRRNQVEVSQRAHVIKALFYAVQSFYAFMLMLLFMTYNGWVMASMVVGAFVGYLLFGNSTSATKDSACH